MSVPRITSIGSSLHFDGFHQAERACGHWISPQRRPGPPGIAKGHTELVLRLARENPHWGYRRIHDEMMTMGIVIPPSSVWTIPKRHGIEPSLRRA